MFIPQTVPDIVVGIDFGMTATGVSYSCGPEWLPPEPIGRWPGLMVHEIRYKAPTQIAYGRQGSGVPHKWGFMIKSDDDIENLDMLFKLNLEPGHASVAGNGITVQQARSLFRDYIQCIYKHIADFFSDVLPKWRSQKVEFLFSIPTNWKEPSMIVTIEELVRQAGFGAGSSGHCANVYISEAEAAAVYASKHQYEKGDILLVCDAGGGTTDVNLLKLESSSGQPSKLTQLGHVEGRAIGSTQINQGICRIIAERLTQIEELLPEPAFKVAEKMIFSERFDNFKCSFGPDMSLEPLPLPIPGLRPGYTRPDLGIEDSKMFLTIQALQAEFDKQIERMFDLIDNEILAMETKYPYEKLSYLVMSGGFGSSPYLRARLRLRYEDHSTGDRLALRDMKVALAKEPQLAVMHGIVMSRTQMIKHREEVFQQRCCRASYGVLIHELHDPMKHVGEELHPDPYDKRVWVRNQIDWIIQQGMPVFDNSIKKQYQCKLKPGTETQAWKAQIVKCDAPLGRLPKSLRTGEAAVICKVETVLAASDMKLKNRHWYSRGPRYYRARFMLNIILGVLDLRFEILSNDGRTCSRGHDVIAVEWGDPSAEVDVSGAPLNANDEVFMFRE